MSTFLLITENKKEEEILKLYLEQSSIKVIVTKPTYANYIESLQYIPSLILIEMPRIYSNHMNFIRQIRKNKKTAGIPIITYGSHSDNLVIQGFKNAGGSIYHPRPLKTAALMKDASVLLQKSGEKLDSQGKPVSKERGTDEEKLLNKATAPETKIEIMVEHVKKLLAFPFTVAKVLKVTQTEDSGAQDLAKAIQSDPVITTTILKVANSVLFASRDRTISDIKEAIVRIGFVETKNIAMGISVMKVFAKDQRNIGFNRVEFWYHSLACAVMSEKLAKNARYPNPEIAFIAGLLHDFGIIILDEFFSSIFETIIRSTTRNGSSFIEEEKALLGIDHNDVAERLFENWKLPAEVIYGTKNLRNYTSIEEKEEENNKILATALGVTHEVVKCRQIGRECDLYVSPIENRFFEKLKYAVGLRGGFFEEVDTQLNMFNKFLNIDNRSFPEVQDNLNDADKIDIAVVEQKKALFNPIDHYLTTQGYKIKKATTPAEIGQLDPPASLIIMHLSPDTVYNDLAAFAQIKNRRAMADPDLPGNIPVLLFVDYNSKIAEGEAPKGFNKLVNDIDLRNIDLAIERAKEGIPIGKPGSFGGQEGGANFTIRNKGKVRIVDIVGALRVSSIGGLRNALMNMLKDGEKYAALNFAGTDFLDSSAIGLLINFHKRVKSIQGKFCIVSLPKKLMKIFRATNIDRALTIIKDDDALSEVFSKSELADVPVSAEESPKADEAETEENPDTE